jgi:hypothetical protein
MRLIHTADLHLDACYAASGLPAPVGNRLRQSAREVFHRIVLRAGDWPADALLIAGDLFESDRVTRDTVNFAISEFQAIAHVPVFIAPGKHDPFSGESPYATENWPRNVTVFRAPNWTRVAIRGGRLIVHGLGYNGEGVPRNPYRNFELEQLDGDGLHVAISYGWEKHPGRKADAKVFDRLAYIALGGMRTAGDPDETISPKAYYSGAPQALGFGDDAGHQFLEIEVLAGEAHVRRVPSSRVSFVALELDCAGLRSVDDVARAARTRLASEALPVLLRLTLTGTCAPAIRGNLRAVQDALTGELHHVQVIDQTIANTEYDALAQEDSSVGSFIRTLNEELRDCTDDARRRLLVRARDAGMAAFTRQACEVTGLEAV